MRSASYTTRLLSLAGDNLGLFTLAGAAEAGIPAVAVHKLAARGFLEKVGKGVYRAPFFPITNASAALEAVLSVDTEAVLEGESVLSLLGIGVFNPRKYRVKTSKRVQRRLPSNVLVTVAEVGPVENYLGVPCQPAKLALEEASKYAAPDQLAQAEKQLQALELA